MILGVVIGRLFLKMEFYLADVVMLVYCTMQRGKTPKNKKLLAYKFLLDTTLRKEFLCGGGKWVNVE